MDDIIGGLTVTVGGVLTLLTGRFWYADRRAGLDPPPLRPQPFLVPSWRRRARVDILTGQLLIVAGVIYTLLALWKAFT